MWTYSLIAQAIGWAVLAFCSPLIFIYVRKVTRYLAYKFFPRDTVLQYQLEGKIVEAYYIRYRAFGRDSIQKLSERELAAMEAEK